MIEQRLRPAEKIGWNLAIGGAATAAGRKNSPEHVRKVAEAHRGRKHTPEVVEANRQRGKEQMTCEFPWDHPYAKKSSWLSAPTIYNWYLEHPKDGRRTVGKALGLTPDSIMLCLTKIKAGWIPTEDVNYLTWFSEQNKLKECNESTLVT